MFMARRDSTERTEGSLVARSSIVSKTLAGFLATIVLLLLAGGQTYRAAAGAAESAQWVAHTQKVRGDLGRFYADVSDAESAERNYILSGNLDYLEDYRRYAGAAGRKVEALGRLVADNPTQVQRLQKLQVMLGERLARLELNRRTFEQSGLAVAKAQVASGEGRQLMLGIRAAGAEMDSVEAKLLATREGDTARDRTKVLGSLFLTLGVAATGFTFLFLGIRRELASRAQAEESLRRSEESLAVTLYSIGDAVLATDTGGRITRMNQICERLTGWPFAEARGRPVGEVFHIINEETRQPAVVPVDNVLTTGEIHGLANHTVLIARDGAEHAIADSAAPIRDEHGQVLGVVLVFRDVTELRRAEAAQRASEAQYRTLFSSIDEGFCIIEMIFDEQAKPADYRFLDFNPAFEKQTGLRDARGKRMRELAPLHEAHWFEIYGGVAMTGEPVRFQNRAEQLHRWFDVHAFRFGEPKQRQVAILFSDITARKQAEVILEHERYLLRTLMDNVPADIYFKDRQSRFLRNTRAHARRLGLADPSQAVGKTDADFFSLEHATQAFEDEQQVIRTGEPIHKEEKETWPDGRETWALTVKLPLRDETGQLAGTFGISYDVTEKKRAEESLRRANAELERASRLKDEFLANMSHELRTPLNAILGMSEALLEQVGGALTPRQTRSITTISTSGRHLLALINDILDLSKIEAGKLELDAEPLDVQEFCESCLMFVRTQAMQKQIGVVFEPDGHVRKFTADPRRFKQILVNLLTNAVKFTPTGGRIGLQVAAPIGEDVVRFTVWDTGIGISSTDATKLFQAFTQVDSGLARTQEGTGLGLALVAQLVELHGGSVELESEPGRGSRFIVTLPAGAHAAAGKSLRTPFDALPALPQPIQRALIIEDDPTTREQLERYLSELQLTSVLSALDEDAVEVALRERPDVILLDIQLPAESGWVVLAKLKEHRGTRHIPVAVISVMDEPEKSRVLGAAAHFTKPITRAQLAGFLQRAAVEVMLPAAPCVESAPTPGPLILLADDNEANLETIGGYLNDKGYALHYARNGLIALNLARDLRPALILMDIQMPVMDGLTAIMEIRADAALKDIPIVALTALAMSGDRERCLAAGAMDYMSKPVNLKALTALLKQLLSTDTKHDETIHSHDPII